MKRKVKNAIIAIAFIVGVELIGFLSSLLAGDIKAVYSALAKPPLSPPPMVFGIVWSIIFALIGLALFFVWRDKPQNRKEIYVVSAMQLTLNFLWSIIFFRFNLYFAALVDIFLLVIMVAYLLYLCHKELKVAFYLQLPYIIWLLFATYLNIGIVLLN